MSTTLLHSAYYQSLLLFSITLILVVLPFVSSTTSFSKQETDEVALKAFKSKIVPDPQGVLNSWNDSHHFCEWEGVTCGRRHRRVTVLDLSSRVPTMEEEELDIQNLTLLQLLSIAIDVASAVDYLHHQCQEPIIHCDLKPSNVLLDSNMTAHVGDFGLVKFLPEVSNQIESSSVGVSGTIGYTPPEYGLGSEVSTRGDVYSYGILLLEMVTRKKPTDFMFEGDLTLHNFARTALPDRVMEIVDPILINEEVAASNHMMSQARNNNNKEQCLISMVRIGVACSMESPQDRMSITHAISELQSVRNILLQPAKWSIKSETSSSSSLGKEIT